MGHIALFAISVFWSDTVSIFQHIINISSFEFIRYLIVTVKKWICCEIDANYWMWKAPKVRELDAFTLGVGGGGVTSTYNKQGCAILTRKVVPKNPGTYLKLRPKKSGTRNTRLPF